MMPVPVCTSKCARGVFCQPYTLGIKCTAGVPIVHWVFIECAFHKLEAYF